MLAVDVHLKIFQVDDLPLPERAEELEREFLVTLFFLIGFVGFPDEIPKCCAVLRPFAGKTAGVTWKRETRASGFPVESLSIVTLSQGR